MIDDVIGYLRHVIGITWTNASLWIESRPSSLIFYSPQPRFERRLYELNTPWTSSHLRILLDLVEFRVNIISPTTHFCTTYSSTLLSTWRHLKRSSFASPCSITEQVQETEQMCECPFRRNDLQTP